MPLCALKIRQKEQREKGWERNIWDSEVKVGYLPKLLFTLPLKQPLSLILDLTDSVGLTGQQTRNPPVFPPQFWNCKEPDPTLGY